MKLPSFAHNQSLCSGPYPGIRLTARRALYLATLLVLPILSICVPARAADPVLAPNAPKDKPVQSNSPARIDAAMAPYIARAKATYPQAKQRYLAGLPKGQSFFITTRLLDGRGHAEQVFIAVQSISGGKVTGRIWSDVMDVQGYRRGDVYSFPESALVDWLITKPDGSEEGNLVGNFLDTYTGR